MQRTFIETLGWLGVVAIVGAYILVSFEIIASDNIPYQALNLFGAAGIVLDALQAKNYQPAVLNIVWFAVAAIAIARILL